MNKKILIVGLGKSGLAAARLALSKNYRVYAIDENISVDLIEKKRILEEGGAVVYLDYSNGKLTKCELGVVSPGFNMNSSLGEMLQKEDTLFISEIEFAYRYCKWPIISITGTNGKTTVTELCTHILKKAGIKVIAAGNIGYPFSELIMKNPDIKVVVLEISSFQLINIDKFKPYCAALLNIESDHIDRHGSYENYIQAKFNILKNVSDYNKIIINTDLISLWKHRVGEMKPLPITFSAVGNDSDLYVENNIIYMGIGNSKRKLIFLKDLPFSGAHNLENLMAALFLCSHFNIDFSCIAEYVKEFKLGEHRLELVAKRNGISYINDSKSTNPASLVVALKAVGNEKNVCLIVGGLDKNMDFSIIAEHKDKIKKIFLVGKCKTKLANLWNAVLIDSNCESFQEAIELACSHAESGDVVLLSPACASMDMFRDYKERGNIFKSIINRRLIDEEKVYS